MMKTRSCNRYISAHICSSAWFCFAVLYSLNAVNAFGTQTRFRAPSSLSSIKVVETNENLAKDGLKRHINAMENKPHTQFADDVASRRQALGVISASLTALTVSPMVASASKAEIDSKSGELFSPKKDMLGGGGSDLARGFKLETKSRQSRNFETNGAPIQVVYETRFVTYLARFLLNFDPAAKSWWEEQSFIGNGKLSVESQQKLRFAEFAESVEVGLADYFVGPYGSYASVQAAKAGLSAQAPQTSSANNLKAEVKTGFFDTVRGKFKKAEPYRRFEDKEAKQVRQGISNLFALLQARYTAPEEKRQLAILFSLITNPKLQPAKEIRSILGEVDNGRISGIELTGLLEDRESFRQSSRHGGGYSAYEKPEVIVESPPALGSSFKPAKINVTIKPTSRVLRIKLLNGGTGYTSSPKVEIQSQSGVKIPCEATALLDRDGSVESIVVLDPGLGYGIYNKRNDLAPAVTISPPKIPRGTSKKDKANFSTAIAVSELEYEIDQIKIVDGGNGYILDQPPRVEIRLPEQDADWYVSPIDRKTWRAVDPNQLGIKITSMTSLTTGEVVSHSISNAEEYEANPSLFETLAKSPLALLPSTLKLDYTEPGQDITELETRSDRNGYFRIVSLPAVLPASLFLPSPRYRAFDPIFGAIGSKPVTKSAKALTGSEYTRLAISGGLCTVIVRTALNPLELVKTKIQLNSDKELFQTVAQLSSPKDKAYLENAKSKVESECSMSKDATDTRKFGTSDVLKGMISLRGPGSLFQSADITFLASVVFGTLGFGATELFRRSFTMVFFPDSTGGTKTTGEELTLLLAAALACVITSLAASPFEILRVRSMGYVEPKPVTTVFSDFVVEKRSKRKKVNKRLRVVDHKDDKHLRQISIGGVSLGKDDIPPLFSGFVPIVSRELPFGVMKFLVFDLVAGAMISIINAQPQVVEPVQVGAGTIGLFVSAFAGAFAGIAGALVSHPADLILTLTSSKQKSNKSDDQGEIQGNSDWKPIVKDLISQDGGVLNLLKGFPARATFFFLVIGLQFFLYDYAKNVFQVGSEDLTLILDVFYAIRQGLQ